MISSQVSSQTPILLNAAQIVPGVFKVSASFQPVARFQKCELVNATFTFPASSYSTGTGAEHLQYA